MKVKELIEGDVLSEAKDAHDIAREIMTKGTKHSAYLVIQGGLEDVADALGKAQKEAAQAKRVGAAGTVEGHTIKKEVLPAFKKLAAIVSAVVKKMEKDAVAK